MVRTITGRPIATALSLAAATVITLATVAAPPAGQPPGPPVHRVSVEAVQLAVAPSVYQELSAIITGRDSRYPLPSGSNPVAPITEQLVRSVATYGTQLLTGQGAQIPGEIANQAKKLAGALGTAVGLVADSVSFVPVLAFSAFLNIAIVVGSLPFSAGALPGLVSTLVNAVAMLPLRWVYTAVAIRNSIAVALQPPEPSHPEPVATTVEVAGEPTDGQSDPEPTRAVVSPRPRASKTGSARSVLPVDRPVRKTASRSQPQPVAATSRTEVGSSTTPKTVDAKHGRRGTARPGPSAHPDPAPPAD